MAKRILIFDTSVLCCLLKVPGKETAGSKSDRWDYDRISKLVRAEAEAKSTLVLPLASIIETGNHIAQAVGDRFTVATRLGEIISKTANAKSPWAAFTDQAELWKEDQLTKLAMNWPELAKAGFSIGDTTIKDVAEYYGRAGYEVEIVTGDSGLKAYDPAPQALVPRRRPRPAR